MLKLYIQDYYFIVNVICISWMDEEVVYSVHFKIVNIVYLFVLLFNVPVNNYGHTEAVS